MLDTNVVSSLVTSPRGPVAVKLAEVGEENVLISVIVRAEVLFGVENRKSQDLTGKVANVLKRLFVASFDPPALS